MNRCLYCYKVLEADNKGSAGYHSSCSRRFFGRSTPPAIEYTAQEMLLIAEQLVKSHKTVPGVQPKLSLGNRKSAGDAGVDRLTIVGLYGEYILKPPTEHYPELPEIEDLTMHLASLSKIRTVEHTLVRLSSGKLAYLTKRVDRTKDGKLHMEDMCQLTERLTEHKYRGSHEQVAKAIRKYSVNPGLDVVNYCELVLFCFLTGNNDMHLKNFSLLKDENKRYGLCPAYDLVASELLVEGDDEELALTLNGKKKRLQRKDFEVAMNSAGVTKKTIETMFANFQELFGEWGTFISTSFLTDELKARYSTMIRSKFKQLEIVV